MPRFLSMGSLISQSRSYGTQDSGEGTQYFLDNDFNKCFPMAWKRTLLPFSMVFRAPLAFLTSPLFEEEVEGYS